MIELDKIYNEDCLKTLSNLEDESIDLIITSPPYNKGYWQTKHSYRKLVIGSKGARKIEYDCYEDSIEPEEYNKWQSTIIEECLRVIKPTGSIFYNHKDLYYKNRIIHPDYIYKFPLHQIIIWDKLSTPNLSKFYFYPVTEYIFWLTKGTPYVDKTDCAFKTSVWRIPSEKQSSHPAPFPIELPRNIIRACSKEGDVVYDPFMGSGTTARAAMEENRHFLGSEVSEKYVNEFNSDVTSLLHNIENRSISI